MAVRGQRFTLDPDADNFTFNIDENETEPHERNANDFVREIREREPTDAPPPPKPRPTKTGFPQHRLRGNVSASKSQHRQHDSIPVKPSATETSQREPSDQAILRQISRKYGLDPDSKERADISEENKRRIAQMSTNDVEAARSEIISQFSPAFIERMLKRANLEEKHNDQDWDEIKSEESVKKEATVLDETQRKKVSFSPALPEEEIVSNTASDNATSNKRFADAQSTNIEPQFQEVAPSMHFPVPRRNPDDYVPLDPDSPSFLADLKRHYFPELSDDPSRLTWLQDPTEEESKESPYAPTQTRYAPSDIRFDFTGRLLAPNESRDIPVSKGLHHHGEAPESAGYTIPELSILARSSLPNQRCVAYQILGRMLYRLGRGDFGPRGSELQEGLWACVEHERPLEVIMSEANRGGGGHMSAKAYATEALWLWRKGGGGERGVLKPGETLAK